MTALPRSLVDTPALGRWIALDAPGRVTVSTGKVELGQGVLTALAQIAADELGLPLDRIVMRPADTDHSPNEGFTAGSLSIEITGAAVRLAAAQAREALLAAAASRLGAPVAALACRDGAILRDGAPTGLDLWSVAVDVDWGQPVRGDAALARAGLVGTSAPRIDMAAKLGAGGFIHDLTMPGLAHARVVRQPFRLARIAGLDEDRLRRRHPGVALLRQADLVALVADDEWAVHRAHADAGSFVFWEEEPTAGAPPRPARR